MVSEAVALAGGPVPAQDDGALAIEVHRRLIGVQVVEDRSKILSAMKLLTRLPVAAVHEDDEMSVGGEQRHLSGRIAAVGAMGVGVDQLPNRQAIGGFYRRN